jgi:hypothetical protein
MTGAALVARLEAWPFLRIQRRGTEVALCFGNQTIGTVDIRSGVLTVYVGGDLSSGLLERHPRLQVGVGGVRLNVTDAEGLHAAEALLRWRMDVGRFAPQWRDASP